LYQFLALPVKCAPTLPHLFALRLQYILAGSSNGWDFLLVGGCPKEGIQS